MKKLYLPLLFSIILLSAYAQAPTFGWMLSSQGNASEVLGTAMVTDNQRKVVYIAGEYYRDTMILGEKVLINTASNNTTPDVFLAKVDMEGQLIWLKSISGKGSEMARHLDVDLDGNIYLAGTFTGSTLNLDTFTIYNWVANRNIYITKIDSNGNVLWARSIGERSNEEIGGLVVNVDGMIYVGGGSEYTDINQLTHMRCLIAKYNTDGVLQWDRIFGWNEGNKEISGITAGNDGSIYATVRFNGNFTIDDIAFPATDNGDYDCGIIKFDTSANAQWGVVMKDVLDDWVFDIAVDEDHVYVTGTFGNRFFLIDTLTIALPLESNGAGYLACIDTGGHVQWARALGGMGTTAMGVCVAPNHQVYFTGDYLFDSMTIGPLVLYNTTRDNEIYLGACSPQGQILWAKTLGGTRGDFSRCITTDADNRIYIGGSTFSPVCRFDTLEAHGASLQNSNLFLARTGPGTASGIPTVNNGLVISVYPNPAGSQLYIDSNDEMYEYSIYNLTGNTIIKTKVHDRPSSIDISALIPGLYMLHIRTNTGELVTKFIK